MLSFKPDFAGARYRWDEFWAGRNTRPLLAAVLPKPGVTPVAMPPYAVGAEGDFTEAIDQVLAWADTHDFLGEAIPFYYLEFAATHFAALLGGDLVFDRGEAGGWSVPCLEDLEEAEIRFRPDCRWWRRTVEFATALRKACEGRLLIAAPTLVANLDALAALRGTEALHMDLVDHPAAVHRALRRISVAHGQIMRGLSDLLDQPRWGTITRHGMYSSGVVSVPQCDFSCMISREMFAEFALPYLRDELNNLDCAEYHLDGPGAIQHLEAVCSLSRISVIQWQPGDGNGAAADWTWLYDRIDQLGKGQVRSGTPEQIEEMVRRSRDPRQFFAVRVRNAQEFEELCERAGRCSRAATPRARGRGAMA